MNEVNRLIKAAEELVNSISFDENGVMIGEKWVGGNGGLISITTIKKSDEVRRALASVKEWRENMDQVMSIKQAAARGISRLRMPNWANPEDHITIDIIDGKPGPWMHFYSPINEQVNGANPLDLLILDTGDKECYVEASKEP